MTEGPLTDGPVSGDPVTEGPVAGDPVTEGPVAGDPVTEGPVAGASGVTVRRVDRTPVRTADLPATPQRDRTIPAEAWDEAPEELLSLGADLGHPVAGYVRRIGRWLVWRAGPAAGGDARYMALAGDDLSRRCTFRVFPDKSGEGVGPDGVLHRRFRAWKEALRDT